MCAADAANASGVVIDIRGENSSGRKKHFALASRPISEQQIRAPRASLLKLLGILARLESTGGNQSTANGFTGRGVRYRRRKSGARIRVAQRGGDDELICRLAALTQARPKVICMSSPESALDGQRRSANVCKFVRMGHRHTRQLAQFTRTKR